MISRKWVSSILKKAFRFEDRLNKKIALQRYYRPSVESLEDRSTPAAIVWEGDVSGAWNDANNWTGGVPTAADDVTIVAPSATVLFQPTLDVNAVTQNLTINLGALLSGGGGFALSVSGNFSNAGTFNAAGSSVFYNAAAGTQTLDAGTATFANVSHSGAGTLQLVNSNLSVGGTLSNAAGAGDFQANGLDVTVTGLTTLAAADYSAGAGTQNFNGGLTINGGTFTGAAGIVNATNVTLTTGTLTAPQQLNVSGNWSKTGGTFTHNNGTVDFTGAGTQTLNSGGTGANSQFNTITHSGAGTLQLITNDLTAAGTLTNSNGITDINGRTVIVGGFTLTGGAVNDVAGGGSITSSSAYDVQAGSIGARLAGTGIALNKTTAATVTLGGANTYTGATTVNAGTLRVDGSLAAGSATAVNNNATLSGAGVINGAVNVNNTAHVAPGTSPGILTAGNVTFVAGTSFDVEITGVTVGTQYDQLLATGDVELGGATLNLFGAYVPVLNDSFIIVKTGGANNITGTFNGLPDGTIIPFNGESLKIVYAPNGKEVRLVFDNNPTVTGTPGDDVFTVSKLGNDIIVKNALGSTVFSRNANALSSLTINGLAGDDTVTVDYASGGFFNLPITFDGGAGGNDKLKVVGDGATTNAIYAPSTGSTATNHVGTVTVNGAVITFSNLEPIDITAMVTATLQTTLTGADDVLTLTNGTNLIGAPGPSAIVVTGTTGGAPIEPVAFFGNTTVVIDTTLNDGNDTIVIASANNAHANTNLTINTGVNTDTVTVSGAVTVTGNVNISSQNIAVNALITGDAVAGTVTLNAGAGAITTSGVGADVSAQNLVATATLGIDLDTTVDNITANNTGTGAVNIDESNGANILSATATTGATTVTTTTGNLTVTAMSASTIATITANAGAILDDGSNATFIVAPSISLTAGDGSIGATGANGQIDVTSTTLNASSTNGSIFVTETDGLTLGIVSATGTGANDVTITSTTGNIGVNSVAAEDTVTLTATAGQINDDANDATVDISATSATLTASTGIGQGANGSLDVNVATLTSATSATGGIAINLLNDAVAAVGLAANHAVAVTLVDATTSGAITLTGTTGSGTRTFTLVDTNSGAIDVSAAAGDIVLGLLTAGTGGTAGAVSVTATTGQITDNASDAIADIIGSSATLGASTGIGLGANGSLDLNVNTLTNAASPTGGIALNLLNDAAAANGLANNHAQSATIQNTTTTGNITLTATTGTGTRSITLTNVTAVALSITGGTGNDTIGWTGVTLTAASTIDGNGGTDNATIGTSSVTGATGNGFTVQNLNTLGVTSSTFSNNTGNGLNLSTIAGTSLTNVTAGDNGVDGVNGVNLSGVTLIDGGTYNSNDDDGLDLDGTGGGSALTLSTNVGNSGSSNNDDGLFAQQFGTVIITNWTFNNNGAATTTGDGIELNTVGGVATTNVTATGNDPGILINGAASYIDTDGNFSNNDNHGIQLIDIAGNVTLVRTTADDNDANNDGVGDGVNATAVVNVDAIGGALLVQGGRFRDSDGAGVVSHQEFGIFVQSVAGAATFQDSVGVVQSVTVTGNERGGVRIDDGGTTGTFTNGSYSSNIGHGIELNRNLNDFSGNVTLTNVNASNNIVNLISANGDGVHAINLNGVTRITGGTFDGNGDDGLDLTGGATLLDTLVIEVGTGNTANSNVDDGAVITGFDLGTAISGRSFNDNDSDNNSAGDGLEISVIGLANTIATSNVNRNARGIRLSSGGGVNDTLFIGTTTIDANTLLTAVDPNGAGILVENGNLTLNTGTVVSNNTTAFGSGGGISFAAGADVGVINNIAIARNKADAGSGGGIHLDAGFANVVALNGSTIGGAAAVDGNTALNGGGIAVAGGTLEVRNNTAFAGVQTAPNPTLIARNSATVSGGGIHVSGGTAAFVQVLPDVAPFFNPVAVGVIDNNSAASGGAIHVAGGTLNLNLSSVTANRALTTTGGGVNVAGGTVTISNSTLSGNTALTDGGGVNVSLGTVSLSNTTVSTNTATSTLGGGLFVSGGTVNLNHATVAFNVGDGVRRTAGTVNAGNSIFARNNGNGLETVPTLNTNPDFFGTVVSTGSNLFQSSVGLIGAVASDRLNVPARLAVLANYGGPTQTHALLPGSHALNGVTVDAAPLPNDQRGLTRPAAKDIGAYESRGFTVTRVSPDRTPVGDVAHRALIGNQFLQFDGVTPLAFVASAASVDRLDPSGANTAINLTGGVLTYIVPTGLATPSGNAPAVAPVAPTIARTTALAPDGFGGFIASATVQAGLTPSLPNTPYDLFATADPNTTPPVVGINTTDWRLLNQKVTTLSYAASGFINVTQANGGLIEFVTSANHLLATGQSVVITGVQNKAAANGTFVVTVTSPTTFTIPVADVGPAGSSGQFAANPTITRSINSVIGHPVNPVQVVSTAHHLTTGQQVTIAGVVGNPAANGTFTVTVIDVNTFSLNGVVAVGNDPGGVGRTLITSAGMQPQNAASGTSNQLGGISFKTLAVANIATALGNGTTVTLTVSPNHGLIVGQTIEVEGVTVGGVIQPVAVNGVPVVGYNGTFVITAVTATTVQYASTATGAGTNGTVSVVQKNLYVTLLDQDNRPVIIDNRAVTLDLIGGDPQGVFNTLASPGLFNAPSAPTINGSVELTDRGIVGFTSMRIFKSNLNTSVPNPYSLNALFTNPALVPPAIPDVDDASSKFNVVPFEFRIEGGTFGGAQQIVLTVTIVESARGQIRLVEVPNSTPNGVGTNQILIQAFDGDFDIDPANNPFANGYVGPVVLTFFAKNNGGIFNIPITAAVTIGGLAVQPTYQMGTGPEGPGSLRLSDVLLPANVDEFLIRAEFTLSDFAGTASVVFDTRSFNAGQFVRSNLGRQRGR